MKSTDGPCNVKFIYSAKATKFCEIFTLLLTGTTLHRTKVRWRFCKILWPSQNIWTLNENINTFSENISPHYDKHMVAGRAKLLKQQKPRIIFPWKKTAWFNFLITKKAGFSKVTVKEYLIMDVPVYRTFFVVYFGGPIWWIWFVTNKEKERWKSNFLLNLEFVSRLSWNIFCLF